MGVRMHRRIDWASRTSWWKRKSLWLSLVWVHAQKMYATFGFRGLFCRLLLHFAWKRAAVATAAPTKCIIMANQTDANASNVCQESWLSALPIGTWLWHLGLANWQLAINAFTKNERIDGIKKKELNIFGGHYGNALMNLFFLRWKLQSWALSHFAIKIDESS